MYRILYISLIIMMSLFPQAGLLNVSAVSNVPEYCINSVRSDLIQIVIDDFGVPITDYGYVAGVNVGPQRNPITIAHHALWNYDVFIKTNASYANFIFLSNADWLANHVQNYGNFSVFEYNFPFNYPSTIIQPVWRSAMAQGLAVEVLSKAYLMTRNSSYLESANNILNAYYVDTGNGGVTEKTKGSGWWYELLANNQGIKPRILNGHLSALLGIYEYYNITSASSAKYLFDQGITALKNNLARFDYENGSYSYYDLSPKRMPSHSYHRLVVAQLQELYEITNDLTIKKYVEKWRDFELPPSIYKTETCRRTIEPPVPIFKPANYMIRVGTSGNDSINGAGSNYIYQSYSPGGLNFTSQVLDYHALNVTLLPNGSKEIVFTLNIDVIHKPYVQIQVSFGSNKSENGWTDENRYAINAGHAESVTIFPSDIIGEEYIGIKSMNVYLPQPGNVTFGVTLD